MIPDETEKDIIIRHIINSLKEFALGDIHKIKDGNNLIATFILCSCFIDQLSGFRYNTEKVGERYREFVKNYLPDYDPAKLYFDLRNKLVHNYSLGDSYSITAKSPKFHLKPVGDRLMINLENFIADVEFAFCRYELELKTDIQTRELAISWHKKNHIMGMDNHDFLSFEEAEKIIATHKNLIGSFSKLSNWPFNLTTLMIVPTATPYDGLCGIVKKSLDNQWAIKTTLSSMGLLNAEFFDIYICGTAIVEEINSTQIAFIRLADYLDWSKNSA